MAEAVITPTHLIGVESKRFEPFRDTKTVSLSSAYDRPVWGGRMDRFAAMRDALRSGELCFRHLDAAQLVKHVFGLLTEARRLSPPPLFSSWMAMKPLLINSIEPRRALEKAQTGAGLLPLHFFRVSVDREAIYPAGATGAYERLFRTSSFHEVLPAPWRPRSE